MKLKVNCKLTGHFAGGGGGGGGGLLVIYLNKGVMYCIALSRILETVDTFHFGGGKVYSMNKGCHTCMIKHTMHVQPLHCSTYLPWLDVCIYLPRSHFHFLIRMLGKG